MTITATKARDIGTSNASAAIDQVSSFDSLENAIESYGLNALQTLGELGVKNGDKVIDETTRAFLAVLAKNGISYKPHGF